MLLDKPSTDYNKATSQITINLAQITIKKN